MNAALSITIGRGLQTPQGRRVFIDSKRPAESISQLLGSHGVDAGWWSPHVWMNNRRSKEEWESASAIAVDIDYHQPATGHTKMPAEFSARVEAAIGTLPGSIAHLTPRGLRLVFSLDQPIIDREGYRRAVLGVAALVENALRDAGLSGEADDDKKILVPGLLIDRQALLDFARLLWTPGAFVPGEPAQRRAKLLVLGGGIYRAQDLATHAPAEGLTAGPADLAEAAPIASRETRPISESLDSRIRKYLEKCEPAISGQHGHDKALAVACKIGPGFDLDEEQAYQYLADLWNPACEPPWSERNLRRKVAEAFKVETRRGWLLNEAFGNRPLPAGASPLPSKGFGGLDGTRGGHDEGPRLPNPRPLPDGLLPVPAFNRELLPKSLRPWIEDIADRMQCPIEFIVAAVIVALGAVLGRGLGIRPKREDDWLVLAHFWGAIVAGPGELKTPAITEAFKPLVRLEIKARQDYAAEMKAYEPKVHEAKAQVDVCKKALKKALDLKLRRASVERARSPLDILRS